MSDANTQRRGEAMKLARKLKIPVHVVNWAIQARDNGGDIDLEPKADHGRLRVRLYRRHLFVQELGARDKRHSLATPKAIYPNPFT